VGDAAESGGGLDLVALFEALPAVPEADAPAEQDRDRRDVHAVDEPGGQEADPSPAPG
jgi:hypothetical protein